MKRSHEQIESLLGNTPSVESLGEGFAARVADGTAGVEPGAMPVAVGVLPASVKGAIMLGAVGVISAGVWVTSFSSPADEEPAFADNGGQVEDEGGSARDKLNDFIVDNVQRSDPLSEGRKMLDDAKRVGSAFVSVFPKDWTEMIWSPGVSRDSGGEADPMNG